MWTFRCLRSTYFSSPLFHVQWRPPKITQLAVRLYSHHFTKCLTKTWLWIVLIPCWESSDLATVSAQLCISEFLEYSGGLNLCDSSHQWSSFAQFIQCYVSILQVNMSWLTLSFVDKVLLCWFLGNFRKDSRGSVCVPCNSFKCLVSSCVNVAWLEVGGRGIGWDSKGLNNVSFLAFSINWAGQSTIWTVKDLFTNTTTILRTRKKIRQLRRRKS